MMIKETVSVTLHNFKKEHWFDRTLFTFVCC